MSFIFLFLALPVVSIAQKPKCPSIPDPYSWTSGSDYTEDSIVVHDCLQWLVNAPLYKNMECRSKVNLFVMEWMAGSPSVTLDIDSRAIPFTAENPELLFSFVHGMALYKLEHKNVVDSMKLHLEGLKVVCRLVEKEEDMKRSKALRQLIRMSKTDKKLNNYLFKLVSSSDKGQSQKL